MSTDFTPRHGGPRKGAGRPTEDKANGLRPYCVSLDIDTVQRAKKLGGGNLSLGLRKALKSLYR